MSFEPLELSYQGLIFGVDEAGRGPLAGPLSIAALHFPAHLLPKVWSGEVLSGLNDSKKLTQKKRESLYSEILSLPVLYSHVFLSHRFIDRFGLSLAIYRGILRLVDDLDIENLFLLIDGNYNFSNRLFRSYRELNYQSIVKGDSRAASIAAASIIAKVRRDRYMTQISSQFPEYEFEKHKGYGSEKHRGLIRKHGISKIHRKSFLGKILATK